MPRDNGGSSIGGGSSGGGGGGGGRPTPSHLFQVDEEDEMEEMDERRGGVGPLLFSLLTEQYVEIARFNVCGTKLCLHTTEIGDFEMKTIVREILLKDTRDFAGNKYRTVLHMHSATPSGSTPASNDQYHHQQGEHQQGVHQQRDQQRGQQQMARPCLSVTMTHHSVTKDVEVLVVLDGGPKIRLVPDALDALATFAQDTMEETAAAAAESLHSRLSCSFQRTSRNNSGRSSGGSSSSGGLRGTSMPTTSGGGGGSGGLLMLTGIPAPLRRPPEMRVQVRATQPEIILLDDSRREQTWSVVVGCTVDTTTTLVQMEEDETWSVQEHASTLDRCRVIARVETALKKKRRYRWWC